MYEGSFPFRAKECKGRFLLGPATSRTCIRLAAPVVKTVVKSSLEIWYFAILCMCVTNAQVDMESLGSNMK